MIETIISALITGAASSAVSIGNDALETAYNTLKSYLTNKYANVDLNKLERDPDDDRGRTLLATALREAVTKQDPELETLSIEVLKKVSNETQESPQDYRFDGPIGPLPINLDINSKIPLIKHFPVGPPVPTHFVPMEDLADILSDEVNQARMAGLIRRAEALRIKHDPEGAKQSATVNMRDLPNPDGGAYDFWFQAINEACSKGPRTLASFLLSLPMGAWMQYGRTTFMSIEQECAHE